MNEQEILGFNEIKRQLAELALTNRAKEQCLALEPFLVEKDLRRNLLLTTQARDLLEENGNPPIPAMLRMEEYLEQIMRGELLSAEEMEETGMFLTAVKRLKQYLEQGEKSGNSLAFYSQNLTEYEELQGEISRSIRGGRIDDYASKALGDIRRKLQELEEKIRTKAESILRANKAYAADSFVVNRNGHVCIPVKKQYRSKVPGSLIDTSGTGQAVFIEPAQVGKLREELEMLEIAEDDEERRILYTLMAEIAEHEAELNENIRVITMLDYVFAKGKLSLEMDAIEPEINTERYISLEQGRHPGIARETCVPLDFKIGKGIRGVVITGPNTGGKTVAIKTTALLSMMACAGLHVPAKRADIAMNSQILCDIGDGQNIEDNLSTFSAHIKNVIRILRLVNEESLVILDELGSGTDPTEGMGIAIAILEQLRKSGALFLVTTHYPEVKTYAERFEEIQNAGMAFDRESLRPLYRLELGKSGESCALYIAKRLGLPGEMLCMAAKEAYHEKAETLMEGLELEDREEKLQKEWAPRIQKNQKMKKTVLLKESFSRGDSVAVGPEGRIGIVVREPDLSGNVLVQIQKEKLTVSHKRLKLLVPAEQLYPEDYDFSIIFDTVEMRKARHLMSRKYVDMELESDDSI